MFSFTIRFLGFLKFVPGVPHVFDAWLKVYTFITQPSILDQVDAIEQEVRGWENVKVVTHKYGGIQFNYGNVEIGHIHGNGLLDMLFNRKIKEQLLREGRVQEHHSIKNTGWISFWLRTNDDHAYAL